MNVAKVLCWLEPHRKLEGPFEDLPLVPIALNLGPGRIVRNRLHLVALAVYGRGAAPIPVDDRIDVNVEAKDIPIEIRIQVHGAMDAIDMSAQASRAVRVLRVIEPELSHVGVDAAV